MFISAKRGGIVLAIVFCCLLFTEMATRLTFHDDNYYLSHRWPIPVGLLEAAVVIRLCSKPGARSQQAAEHRWYISRSSDFSETYPERNHHLLSVIQFFREQDSYLLVPVRYWPWILAVLALFLYCVPLQNYF